MNRDPGRRTRHKVSFLSFLSFPSLSFLLIYNMSKVKTQVLLALPWTESISDGEINQSLSWWLNLLTCLSCLFQTLTCSMTRQAGEKAYPWWQLGCSVAQLTYALAWCMAGPSSNLGSALQGGFALWATSNEAMKRGLGEWSGDVYAV